MASQPATKKSRKKDPAWKYGTEVQGPLIRGRHVSYATCKFCDKRVPGGISRFKSHIGQTHKEVSACPNVPPEVTQEILTQLLHDEGSKAIEQQNFQYLVNGGSHYHAQTESTYNHMVGSEPTPTATSDRGIRGPMDSPYFVNMVRSVGEYGRGLKPPSMYELNSWVLKEEVKLTNDMVDNAKRTWAENGVTIMSDGWTDIRKRQLINFLVNTPDETVFLKTIDASKHVKDAGRLFQMLNEIVEEVGEEHVVQVVTENVVAYKAAGDLLMQKWRRLYWTPCAEYCIDLILEKLFEEGSEKDYNEGCELLSWIGIFIKGYKTLVGILRLVDSEATPAMRFIYGAMDKAKEEIARNFGNEEPKYKDIWEIIDENWDFQMHKDLHDAGYFLNPQFQYEENVSNHPEIKSSIDNCMEKLLPREDVVEAHMDLDKYLNKEGHFGRLEA
ncbi:uncharacterized protein LOC113279103 [Papaver somniferum]|uniref:uncharacterized protein LOC113279103 n=1 Tax=Papaver somniferum TaxID=3469 RepID=UPI000E6FB576|nr:uncharacterized protein LOC113279103 [Papaver somniferum]